MGMPIIIEIVDPQATTTDFKEAFSLFKKIDAQFSPYKRTSEVSRINRKELNERDYSVEMCEILRLSEETKRETKGYFDVYRNGYFDPSGIVKGWAIQKVYTLLKNKGFKNFYINAGGDVQVSGINSRGEKWSVGIRHPFEKEKMVKVVTLENCGIATSGTYLRGEHIYDPSEKAKRVDDIVGLTVIGRDIYDADRYATAAFAMGKKGINFINSLSGYAGYMIDREGVGTYTQNFEKYIAP